MTNHNAGRHACTTGSTSGRWLRGALPVLGAVVLAFFTIAGPAKAQQTIGYAEAIDTLAQTCGEDINKLCKNASLANFGIIDCLAQNQNAVSGRCIQSVNSVGAALRARADAQDTAYQTCSRDIQQYCPLTKGGRGRVLRCLLKAQHSVSNRCNAAITAAGWR